jgi:hypothetical protein
MIKSTFIIFLVLCSTIPNLSFAQIFDPKISQDYYYNHMEMKPRLERHMIF